MSTETTVRTTPELIAAAREWILDAWDDAEPDDVQAYGNLVIIRIVQRHYEGGWSAFVADFGA